MKRRRLIGYMGLMAIVSTLTISCNNVPPGSTPEATAPDVAVVSNGELTIYSGRNENLIGPLLEEFEAETGTKVNVRYGDTAELAAAILEEGANTPADLFFGQDAGALGALQKENRARTLPEPILEKVDVRFRSPEGQWIGISGRARVLDYNTERVQPSELPNSIWELTEEKWRGRVGWAPTNGSFQSFVTALRLTEGDEKTLEWLKAMRANDVQVYNNNTGIVEALGRGEVDIGLVNNYYLGRFKAENPNFPVAHHYTQEDAGSMVNVAGVAMINESDQQEAALGLIEYLLSPQSQAYFAEETNEYPLVKGSPSPKDQIPLDQIKAPQIDLSNLDDLEGTLVLLKQSGAL
ncbi:iron ABC transporter substrate-binding protein [Candidatus Synechococcus calcipolaris G9]|uniref:Iron ABC transporter substrate-binding protein n=1 Tax=Candidatus Synechococcus calcipolaris G9 TaxID=1497997 RepID=A0ABT6EZG2_9SYNE|nr:iron ABC transporter substrate-binding protein [Candidatus Synechococcus calcipolaris]MDG2990993.1 iron ABC transporter substrate-binding protein [Candidatus Synechococcus calcipolaris G9]